MGQLGDKYRRLEEEYIEKRAQSRADLIAFEEGDVGRRLSNVTNHKQKMLARLKNNNIVSVETSYLVL